jgi:hypothetical protein
MVRDGALVVGLAALAAAGSCSGDALPFAGICGSLDQAGCGRQPNCTWVGCPGCPGSGGGTGQCYLSSQAPEGSPCPAIACADPCSTLDQANCANNSACEAIVCAGCNGSSSFEGCYLAGTGPGCPGLDCAQPTDGGPTDGGGPCDNLDQAACQAMAGCTYFNSCTDCNGNVIAGTEACLNPGQAPTGCPPVACPGSDCPSLDEAACMAASDCQVHTCPDCNGNQVFGACIPAGQTADCPQPQCPPPGQCQGLDQQTCAMNANCHAVFMPGQGCGCATAGCCTFFSYCADGATAVCSGMPVCNSAPPDCQGDYVVSYIPNGGCYEGCVLSSECAM